MDWQLRGSAIILKTDTLRTCRNFAAIDEWAQKRVPDYATKEDLLDGDCYVVD